jgi:hypothetical protein
MNISRKIKATRRTTCTFVILALFSCVGRAQVAVAPLQLARQQFLSSTGVPLASGCMDFFATGTSTRQAIYADSGGVNQLSNPLTLDAAGEASVWMTNVGYDIVANTGVANTLCSVSEGTQLWKEINKNPWSIINSGSNFIVASGTVDPSSVAGELAYRSDIPCFRGFTTIWDCFVTLTGTQTLTNKTLTTPTIVSPAITGTISGNPTIASPTFSGTAGGTANFFPVTLLNSGTNASNSTFWRGDGTWALAAGIVYSTSTSSSTSIPATTMTAVPINFGLSSVYRIVFYVNQGVVGVGCTGNTTILANVLWTDPSSGTSQIFSADTGFVIVGNGTASKPLSISASSNILSPMVLIRAASATNIQFSTTYTLGTGCTSNPGYVINPYLEKIG